MAVTNEMTASELNNYIRGVTGGAAQVQQMLMTNMSGVEGLPYQFMENVDRRIIGTDMGRKYSEKIIARLPLLFLTPCKPVFMDGFNKSDKSTAINGILDSSLNIDSSLFQGQGRYYAPQFDYSTYYGYVNTMLTSVAAFLGIYDEEININGTTSKVGTYPWQKGDLNEAFKSFFSAQENVIFYLDGMTSVSESFTNDTGESSLASQINGYADTSNEIRFLFGDKGSFLGNIIDKTSEVTSSISSSLSSVLGNLGGGIVESLADKGVNTIVNGGKIVFPKIWTDSNYSRSYSLNIKLRSPDHDNLSIFLNVLKPYCKLLCLCLPRLMEDPLNPNGYRSPFLVKAFCKGLFNIDYGMITGMSVTKGDTCCWNDDGLPTQIDISLEIEDLYSSLAMSSFNDNKVSNVVSNTSYMDYLANMAGLNIGQEEVGRRYKMWYYLEQAKVKQTPQRLFTNFDNHISSLVGKLYNITS